MLCTITDILLKPSSAQVFDQKTPCVQVTSLALCKVNKSEMFLRRLSQHFRHERTHDLFWKTDEVPQEALEILKASSLLTWHNHHRAPGNLGKHGFTPIQGRALWVVQCCVRKSQG